jgi:c(7)-type cytochrome triheme protein
MRAVFLALALVLGAASAADNAKLPEKLVFPSTSGPVTFDHAAHVKSRGGHCAPCHDKLWPKSAKEPLKSSDGCRTCHQAAGPAFEMKGNCKRCHVETGEKSGPQ